MQTEEKKKKTYYFLGREYIDQCFGAGEPVCVDVKERERLVQEWEQPDKPELTKTAL